MRVTDLEPDHLEQARRLATRAYADERAAVPALPPAEIPDLAGFAANGLGVAALQDDTLIGFLGWLRPWDGAFGDVRGAFAPVHAHGTVVKGRADIYDHLYQAASERWVANGILSHAIALYAHDEAAQASFFDNGFGGRTVDAIRDLSPISALVPVDIAIRELGPDDVEAIIPLSDGLFGHLRQPPMFMPVQGPSPADIASSIAEGRHRYVAAFDRDRPVAFLRWEASGETFASEDPSMMNITGAFALPEVRGSGVADALMAWLVDLLRSEGYSHCGVDFETFNPVGRHFWLRHLTAYSVGVVRRIDERIVRVGSVPE